MVKTLEDTVAPSRRFLLFRKISKRTSTEHGKQHVPFTAGLRDQLSKIPQSTLRQNLAGGGVSLWCPFPRQSQRRPSAGLFILRNEYDALFLKPLICVLERLLVDSLEVREISLVVQRFTKLEEVSQTPKRE